MNSKVFRPWSCTVLQCLESSPTLPYSAKSKGVRLVSVNSTQNKSEGGMEGEGEGKGEDDGDEDDEEVEGEDDEDDGDDQNTGSVEH